MVQTKTNEELEKEDLMRLLQGSVDEINEYLPSFRAIIDKSGDIPQQHVHKK